VHVASLATRPLLFSFPKTDEGNEMAEEQNSEFPDYNRDEEIKAKQEEELAAERDEHNRRTGGGEYAKK